MMKEQSTMHRDADLTPCDAGPALCTTDVENLRALRRFLWHRRLAGGITGGTPVPQFGCGRRPRCGTGFQPVRRKNARPARKLLRWVVKWGLASMLLMEVVNCRQTVIAPNLVAGVRDGLVTTTSGIIQDLFNALFNLDGGNQDASGNGSFSGI